MGKGYAPLAYRLQYRAVRTQLEGGVAESHASSLIYSPQHFEMKVNVHERLVNH